MELLIENLRGREVVLESEVLIVVWNGDVMKFVGGVKRWFCWEFD